MPGFICGMYIALCMFSSSTGVILHGLAFLTDPWLQVFGKALQIYIDLLA